MNEILFLLFAFFTVFLSIKLSYYADYLSKSSKVSNAFLGGVLLAGVTSLPEFVTCFSAIFVNNELLAIGDILGSNIFNIFMICFFDLLFVKKKLFSSYDRTNRLLFRLLIINYIFMYFFVKIIPFFNPLFIGLSTFFIFVTYAYYLFRLSKREDNSLVINDSFCDNVVIKMLITALLMIFSSVILTIIVNKLSHMHPYFSSSFLGAIFLGITTSLPEVVTCYTLISINSFELALSDIIGSNFFNLLVLSIGDLFVKKNIYIYSDSDAFILILLGLLFTLLCFVSNSKRFLKYDKLYGVLSFIVVVMYFSYWIINFLG